MGDHRFDLGLLVLDLCLVPPRGGNHVIPAAPITVSSRNSADVQFDSGGHRIAKSVEVAPDIMAA